MNALTTPDARGGGGTPNNPGPNGPDEPPPDNPSGSAGLAVAP
ncbi:hypothetical protein [Nocardioides anomalus]|nr:hypothetical protein [Nocardioides anomalus]